MAARMLNRDEYRCYWDSHARVFLKEFLIGFRDLFGEKNCVCCVHKVMHLVDECLLHGTLYSFSAYPFETFMGSIMKLTRYSHTSLMQQIDRRVDEISRAQEILYKEEEGKQLKFLKLSKKSNKIRKLSFNGVILALNFKDQHFVDVHDRCLFLVDMEVGGNGVDVSLSCRRMCFTLYCWIKGNLYNGVIKITPNEIKAKLFCLPFSEDLETLLVMTMGNE